MKKLIATLLTTGIALSVAPPFLLEAKYVSSTSPLSFSEETPADDDAIPYVSSTNEAYVRSQQKDNNEPQQTSQYVATSQSKTVTPAQINLTSNPPNSASLSSTSAVIGSGLVEGSLITADEVEIAPVDDTLVSVAPLDESQIELFAIDSVVNELAEEANQVEYAIDSVVNTMVEEVVKEVISQPVVATQKVSNPFTDVQPTNWFYADVMNIYSRGLMSSVNGTTFQPQAPVTRAMMVTILHRLDSNLPMLSGFAFSDVPADAWYAQAVNWADQLDITGGFSDGTFRPNDPITRQELTVMIYNFARYKGFDMSATGSIQNYTDASSVPSWSKTPIEWAIGNRVLGGKDKGRLDPRGMATRAEVSAMLTRYMRLTK